MKEAELRKHATCALCGKLILESGLPLFWRAKIERFGIDIAAMNRLQGLTMMLGGHASLASIMGPDEDLARPMMEAVTLSVCEPCAMNDTCVAAMAEMGAAATPEREGNRP